MEPLLAAASVVGAFDPVTVAMRSSSRVAQARRARTFSCSRLKNDSVAALSPAAPTRPIDPIIP